MFYKTKKFLRLIIAIIRSILFHNGKVALCCIAKMENDYIKEFVEYYRNNGFDNVFIYDNNDVDGEHFEEILKDEINSGYCKIINYRGREVCQITAYQDFYERFGKDFDWIAFFDVDEFLSFVDKGEDIHSFLTKRKFTLFQAIHINWLEYGDSDSLDNDGRNVVDRLTKVIEPIDFKCSTDRPENDTIKTIVRGRMPLVECKIHNSGAYYMRCCNPAGKKCDGSPYNNYDYADAYIKHYTTKTIGEWVKIKQKRGYPDMKYEDAKQFLGLDHFFKLNVYSKEKEEYAKSLLK